MSSSTTSDDRAQSASIGFILFFAFLIMAVVGWQVSVVPGQNANVEYDHVQAVQGQMQELGATIESMERASASRDMPVSLGTTYPDRTIFVNPPPPGGRLRTVGNGEFTANVTNATALDEEVDDIWNGSNRSFGTAGFVYTPFVTEHQGAPDEIVVENSLVYSTYDDYRSIHANQSLVDGRDISLSLVNGSFSEAKTGSREATNVRLWPASASTTTVRIRNDTDPITIRVPTKLDTETWETRLADERRNGHVTNVTVKTANVGAPNWNLLVITLEPGVTYRLQVSKVHVGQQAPAPEEPAYLTASSDGGDSMAEESTRTVTFQVRDRYDNPVRDTTVNVSLDGDGALRFGGQEQTSYSDLRTDSNGEVTLTYVVGNVDGDESVEIRANRSGSARGANFDRDRPSDALVAFTVVDSDGSGSSGSGGGGGGGAYTVQWDESEPVAVDASTSVFQLNATTGDIPNASVEFSVNDSSVISVTNATNTSDADGVASANFTVEGTGTAFAYVTGGGSGDRIVVAVSAAPSQPAYITAVEPDPEALADNDGEFIEVWVDGSRNTGDWVVRDDESGSGETSAVVPGSADGLVWFVRNETAFRDQWVVPSDVTLVEFDPGGNGVLANSGEPLELVNTSSGDVIDEFAYGGETTSNGWSLTLDSGDVAVRKTDANGDYVDTDSASDWRIEDESSFFDAVGGPPGVQRATVSNAPINYSDTDTTQTVTVTFNKTMDTGVDPTVEIIDLPNSTDLTVSGSWLDATTWEGTVDFPKNDDDTTATIRIADAQDDDGTIQEPNPDTSNTFIVDTDRPNDPGETRLVTAPINASNEDAVTVEVDVDDPDPDGGTVIVQLEDDEGNTVTASAPMQTGSGTVTTTISGIDVSTLSDADPDVDVGVIATATVVDDVGNENPSGFTSESDEVLKDTKAPAIESFTLTNPSGSELRVELQTNESLSEIAVDIENSSGAVVATLTRGDFSESESGGTYTYTAPTTVSENDDYTAVLNVTKDDAGNDGAAGETDTATVFDYGNQLLQPTASVGDEIRDSGDRLVFRLENTAGSQVTIEQFSVDTTAIQTGVQINDKNAEEFEITRTSVQDGLATRNGNPAAFDADGTRYDMEADSSGNQGQYATLASADDDVELDFRTFEDNQGTVDLGTLVLTDSPEDADVVLVVVLSDGTEQVFYFEQA